jgi:hypothetical protein
MMGERIKNGDGSRWRYIALGFAAVAAYSGFSAGSGYFDLRDDQALASHVKVANNCYLTGVTEQRVDDTNNRMLSDAAVAGFTGIMAAMTFGFSYTTRRRPKNAPPPIPPTPPPSAPSPHTPS